VTVRKDKDIWDKTIYFMNGSSTKYSYTLPTGTMVYDTQSECSSFCDTTLGDRN